ncbi:MAG: T9SS type A sorting domain-containing protein, partial [Phaeodactylibacter sp.]|nr:T9SS type A sorting domain-containing protein [Phaeodactylibacter sp.]
APGNGGGVHITGPGDIDITGGVVSNNTASAEGGGLWNGTGLMTITRVKIDGNSATGASADQGGGGVFNAGGMIMIAASTISNNTVDGDGSGAGVHNDAGGTVMLRYGTISGNHSNTTGGGITNTGTFTIVASTIANNSAGADGGGVFQTNADNSIDFSSSIVATNTAGGAGVDIAGMGTITSSGYNLIGIDDTDSFMGDATDVEGDMASPADPNLEPLADNGGMTDTHAIGCPSPATNAGDPNNMDPDQRGEMVFEGRRDMGAYERQEACTVGIEELEPLLGSTVYPNPVRSGQLTLEIPDRTNMEVWIQVTEAATGRLLFQQQATTGQVQLDLSTFSSGLYHIQVQTAEAVAIHKVVVLNE